MAANPGYVETVGRKISGELAARLGVAVPPDAWRAFAAQVANETASGDASTRGVRNNNPLNLTDAGGAIQWSGQVASDGPFAVFGSVDEGVRASVQNLLAADYQGVRSAFVQSGDPTAIVHAIESSPWDAGHYSGNLASMIPQGSETYIGGASNPHADDGSCWPGFHKVGGVCVPILNPAQVITGAGASAGVGVASGEDVGSAVGGAVSSAINNAFSPIGSAISGIGDRALTGARQLVIAGVVIAAVAALTVAGTRRTLS